MVVVWAGIDFLEFRASEIAAAVALSVSGEHHTINFDKFSFSTLFSHLEKVRKKNHQKSLLFTKLGGSNS